MVDRGELVAIMGPSGSGKSTLLTIAGSLEDAADGEVLIDGAAVSAMSRDERARMRRRSIGYVFQDLNLLAGLTAAENVSLPLELDGITAGHARAAAAVGRARTFRDRSSRDAVGPRPARDGSRMLSYRGTSAVMVLPCGRERARIAMCAMPSAAPRAALKASHRTMSGIDQKSCS